MFYKTRRLVSLFFGGTFFILDRILKYLALYTWPEPKTAFGSVGWNPFLNPGIAFGIPVPNWLIISLTIPIVFIVGYLIFFNSKKSFSSLKENGTHSIPSKSSQEFFIWLALIFILSGALSNLIDRIIYQHTVDYVLIFTGIINLADVLIVSGFVIYFTQTLKQKRIKE